MPQAQYVSPQVESAILKLNELGRHYLELQKNMTFTERTFGLRKNGDRAKELSELTVAKIYKPGISSFYYASLGKIDSCKATSKGKWLNENLREDFIMKSRFLDHIYSVVWLSNPGRTFIPGVLKILTDAGFKYDSSDVKKGNSVVHAMSINLLREIDEYLNQETIHQNGFLEGHQAAINTPKDTKEKATQTIETQEVKFSLRR